MIRVGSANYEACKALNMDIVERGIYEKWISVDDADCIWREESYGFRGGEYFSGEIEVIKGTVKVKAEDVTKSFDKFDTKFCKRGSFAIYNEGVYRSYDGVNNNVLYHLASYDIESQDQGFILDSPGRFSKMVSANEVSFSYESHTWCEYCGKKFSITEGEGDIVLLEPYSRDDYSTMELGSLGFCLFKTRWVGLSIILCFYLPFTIETDLFRILNGFCSEFGASTADEGFGEPPRRAPQGLPQMRFYLVWEEDR